MRIQQMDQILKESRYSRRAAGAKREDAGFVARVWRSLTNLLHITAR